MFLQQESSKEIKIKFAH